MPWQRQVADVAGERLPDGRYAYPIVVVSVPRQSGKTTLLRAVGVSRMLELPDYGVFYTAQTGKDARARWRDLVKKVERSPLAAHARVWQSAGSERLELPNASVFQCFAPKPDALHGYTPPLVMLDEAWSYDSELGEELMGAIKPAQITLPHRQLWIVSTAGTADSDFLHKWIDTALEGAEGVAGFLWSAPDGADIYDPTVWPTFHPALGHTIAPADLAEAAAVHSRAEYERAYGNRRTSTRSHVVAPETWTDLRLELEPVPLESVVLTYDVAHDRTASTILATWQAGDRIACKIVERRPGLEWVAPRLAEVYAAHPGVTIGADDGGPARLVSRVLVEDHGVPVEVLNGSSAGTAFTGWMRLIETGRLAHDGDETLAHAVSVLAVRTTGDVVAPSRRHSAGDISPVVAMTTGTYLADRLAVDDRPQLYIPGASA